ncbi:hypothetical protein LCGC14_3153590, partial [marine sediment metagenome]
ESGYPSVIKFLFEEDYLNFLNHEESQMILNRGIEKFKVIFTGLELFTVLRRKNLLRYLNNEEHDRVLRTVWEVLKLPKFEIQDEIRFLIDEPYLDYLNDSEIDVIFESEKIRKALITHIDIKKDLIPFLIKYVNRGSQKAFKFLKDILYNNGSELELLNIFGINNLLNYLDRNEYSQIMKKFRTDFFNTLKMGSKVKVEQSLFKYLDYLGENDIEIIFENERVREILVEDLHNLKNHLIPSLKKLIGKGSQKAHKLLKEIILDNSSKLEFFSSFKEHTLSFYLKKNEYNQVLSTFKEQLLHELENLPLYESIFIIEENILDYFNADEMEIFMKESK